MRWKSVKKIALNNCVAAMLILLMWHFFLNKNWPTSGAAAIFWAIGMTVIQVLMAGVKERKRTRTEAR